MLRSLAITILLLAVPSFAHAADSGCSSSSGSDKTFVLRHSTEEYKDTKGDWKRLAGGATIRVPAGKTVVLVTGTNTAVFDYQFSTEPVDVPEAKALNAFLESFGPYAVDILRTGREATFAEVAGIDRDLLVALEKALVALDREIDGVRQRRTQVLGAYAESEAQSLRQAVAAICSSREGCVSLFDGLTSSLLEKYGDVESKLIAVLGKRDAMEAAALRPELDNEKQLASLEREGASSDSRHDAVAALIESRQARVAFEQDLKSLVSSARKALDDSQKVLELVRTLERAALDGLEALPTWTSPPFPISLQKGRKLTLKITPKPIATIASAGRLPKVDLAFTLLPQWSIRPTVGLSLLWADGATYPTFGTAKTSVMVDDTAVDRFEIVEKDLEDRRATYGLDLGLTARKLCTESGNCPWLDVIVNPSDDVRALGLGASYNFGILKIGGGVLWTKHKELAGDLAVGDLLESEGALKTRDSYSGEEFFVSLSVIGWEPFVDD